MNSVDPTRTWRGKGHWSLRTSTSTPGLKPIALSRRRRDSVAECGGEQVLDLKHRLKASLKEVAKPVHPRIVCLL
mgnify:CR=1 FL=1